MIGKSASARASRLRSSASLNGAMSRRGTCGRGGPESPAPRRAPRRRTNCRMPSSPGRSRRSTRVRASSGAPAAGPEFGRGDRVDGPWITEPADRPDEDHPVPLDRPRRRVLRPPWRRRRSRLRPRFRSPERPQNQAQSPTRQKSQACVSGMSQMPIPKTERVCCPIWAITIVPRRVTQGHETSSRETPTRIGQVAGTGQKKTAPALTRDDHGND